MIKKAKNKKFNYIEIIGPFEVWVMGKTAYVHFFTDDYVKKFKQNPNIPKVKAEIQKYLKKYLAFDQIAVLKPEHLLSEDIMDFINKGRFKNVVVEATTK